MSFWNPRQWDNAPARLDIPELRRFRTPENARWLQRNLMIRNAGPEAEKLLNEVNAFLRRRTAHV